jgi:hypothetical protein
MNKNEYFFIDFYQSNAGLTCIYFFLIVQNLICSNNILRVVIIKYRNL